MRIAARRLAAVVRTTAVEFLGEPFVFLTILSSLALAVLAPSVHYHQFGEPARMARDAGFSALLLGGSVAAVFGTIRAVRREIESGTCEAALAHAISPCAFLFAKALGAAVACGLFLIAIAAVTVVLVNGVEIGHTLAAFHGTLPRPWGPSLAAGVAVLVLPVFLAALLNRFARCRFTLTASALTVALAVLSLAIRPRLSLFARYFPATALAAVPVVFLLLAAAVFAFRFRAHVAAALTGLVALGILPALGNYCVAEALANGARIAGDYFLRAGAAALPAFGVLVALGILFANRREED